MVDKLIINSKSKEEEREQMSEKIEKFKRDVEFLEKERNDAVFGSRELQLQVCSIIH
jgi:hypothetical protein